MKKAKRISLVAVVVVALIAAALLIASKLPHPERCYRMFESISELDKLEDYVIGEAEDPYLGDVVPQEHYCKLVAYEGEEYLVAGYTFDSLLDTLRFQQCNIWNDNWNPELEKSGVDPFFWDEGFRQYTTLGKTKLSYYYETNLLLIESSTAKSKQLEEFQRWLAESFTREMPMADVMAELHEPPATDDKTEEAST